MSNSAKRHKADCLSGLDSAIQLLKDMRSIADGSEQGGARDFMELHIEATHQLGRALAGALVPVLEVEDDNLPALTNG